MRLSGDSSVWNIPAAQGCQVIAAGTGGAPGGFPALYAAVLSILLYPGDENVYPEQSFPVFYNFLPPVAGNGEAPGADGGDAPEVP